VGAAARAGVDVRVEVVDLTARPLLDRTLRQSVPWAVGKTQASSVIPVVRFRSAFDATGASERIRSGLT
jgi:hypothetical protein